jgi:hypothetical protein
MVSTLPAPSRLSRRGLQASEHRGLLMAGDAVVACIAVVVAVWLWTLTSGFGLATAIRSHVAWFLGVPLWMAGLVSAYNLRAALSLSQT